MTKPVSTRSPQPGEPNVRDSVFLGTVPLKNRLVLAPMVTLFAERADRPGKDHIRFYTSRAASGVGLAMIGATAVSEGGRGFDNQMIIDSDSKVQSFHTLAESVQASCPAILQLFHAGPKTSRALTGRSVISAVDRRSTKPKYDDARAATSAEVANVVDEFVGASVLALKCGFRGISLHAANGYLLHWFCDRACESRVDQWQTPGLLVAEIVRLIRKQVRRDFLIGCTLGSAPADGSLPHEQNEACTKELLNGILALLSQAGMDFLHIYHGRNDAGGRDRLFTESLRSNLLATVAVIEGSNVRSASDAQEFIRQGVDFVAIGRALLADPDILRTGGSVPESTMKRLADSEQVRRFFSGGSL